MSSRLKNRLKTFFKLFQASQPFNFVATSSLKIVLRALHRQPHWVSRYLRRVGVVSARLPDGSLLRLWSRGDDVVSNEVFWWGWDGFEPETAPLFFRLAQRSATTLDIGAHVGIFTVIAARANPQGKVWAFEPMPPVFERLQRNVALNGLSNVRCTRVAAGERDGSAEFFHPGSANTDATLPTRSSLSFDFMKNVKGLQKTTVPVITLDAFVREQNIERVTLLKIDTENTEPQVLRGMENTLRRDRPTMICEVIAGRGSGPLLAEILAPMGYNFYQLTPHGPQQRQQIEGHPKWMNYLLTPLDAEAVARL